MKTDIQVTAAPPEKEVEEAPKVLSLKEKIAYGVGDMGNNFLFDMGQLYLLKYFTDVVHLPAALAGGVFAIAKIWDAFADIGVGTWVDNRTKIGKRGKFRPFILWAALPLAIMLVANFTIPNFSMTGKAVWAYVTYMIFGTVYSISNVPFGSMQPSMTKNSVERSELASWRNIGSNTGLLIATVAFMPIVMLLPTQQTGYTVTVIIFAVLGVASQLFCYKNTKENYRVEPKEPEGEKKTFKEIFVGYKAVFKNGPLLILCLANLFTFSAYNVKLAVQFYFAQYVLDNIKIVSYMSFFTVGFSILAAAVMPSITKRIGKKHTYILGSAIWLISDIIGYFFTDSGLTFAIFTSISYFGNGILTALNWALISDVVEYGEWKTHVRSEGIVYSSYTYFRKLATAAAGFIPGLVLSMVGYIPNQQQTAGAIAGIRGIEFIYPVVMAGLTAILMFFYPITEDKYSEIMADLNLRHKKDEQ